MASNHPLLSLGLAIALLLCGNHGCFTSAASGGRMGGSHFSSDSSSDSSESSWPKDSPYPSSQQHLWAGAPTYYKRHVSDSRTTGDDYGRSSGGDEEGYGWRALCTVIAVLGGGFVLVRFSKKSTLLMLQFGLSGETLLPIQTDLNMIAERADTSTVQGLKHMLTETAVMLLRHADHFTHGYSYVYNRWNEEDTEKRYNHLSVEERQKFDVESLSNVNNIKTKRTASVQKRDKPTKEYVVVTILLAAKGRHRIPEVKDGIEEVKEALRYLQSISSKRMLAAEVLWSPQDDTDSISDQELHGKYPLLRLF